MSSSPQSTTSAAASASSSAARTGWCGQAWRRARRDTEGTRGRGAGGEPATGNKYKTLNFPCFSTYSPLHILIENCIIIVPGGCAIAPLGLVSNCWLVLSPPGHTRTGTGIGGCLWRSSTKVKGLSFVFLFLSCCKHSGGRRRGTRKRLPTLPRQAPLHFFFPFHSLPFGFWKQTTFSLLLLPRLRTK